MARDILLQEKVSPESVSEATAIQTGTLQRKEYIVAAAAELPPAATAW
jgi:hypothetical protein